VSQTEGQLPSEQVPFRTIQIVIGALMFGALVFAVIAYSVAQPPRAGNELLAYVAAGFAGLQLVMSLVVPAIAIRQKLQELQARSSASGSVLAMDYFNVYQTRSIVRAALLESAAFFGGVAYIVSGVWWILATALALIAVIGIFFPTKSRFDEWVRGQRELASLDNATDI